MHGGVPEHFLLDFLHARHAVETLFFHGVSVPVSVIAVEFAVPVEDLVSLGGAVELDAWVDVLNGGGLLWSEMGEGPVM